MKEQENVRNQQKQLSKDCIYLGKFKAFSGVGNQRMALKNIGCNFEVVEISKVDKIRILSEIKLDK